MDAPEHRNLAPDVYSALNGKLRWRLNRLRCMTPAEVMFRIVRLAQARAQRAGLVGDREVPVPRPELPSTPWVHVPAGIDASRYVEAAERISDGYLDIFALRGYAIGQSPRWNRDPKTGIEVPLVYGKDLDYRDPHRVGDIKYLWEPNRHLHFVTLAQAHALTGKRKYVDTLAAHLTSWLAACPYGRGPNWTSALEAAIRLINWSIAWQIMGGMQAAAFPEPSYRDLAGRWLRSIYQHCEFIRGWLSLHSSANHHLIGQGAALLTAGLAWPHWRESAAWVATGRTILEREALAQNAADGVNREQAICCQQFVLHLLVLSLLALKGHGERFSATYEARVEAMLDYLASVTDAGGNVPQFGDADDGQAYRLAPGDASPYRAILGVGAILFRRGDFRAKAGPLDDSARWLLGPKADEEYQAVDTKTTRLPLRQAFAEGGYYVLGCEFDKPHEIRIVVDAGPLGYGSTAAHGHADALAFTLSAGGEEFLIDSGTYTYHTQVPWRRYFRGTGAHNTVRVDGMDQCVQGGNFLWLKKARAHCSLWLSSAEKDTFEGWHDGYMRLADPVKHRRLVELDKVARRVLVEDSLEMAEDHVIELFFHCHEACGVEPAEDGFVLSRGKNRLHLSLPRLQNAGTQVLRGRLSPIAGWVSRSFDSRVPTSTIVWSARLSGRVVLRSEILVCF